ncbi:MAG: S9 family peptidase [Candidatus Aminicenantales bacterium]
MKGRRNYISLSCLLVLTILLSFLSNAWAQVGGKKLTFEQAFLNAPPRLLKRMITVRSWFDDKNYLILKSEENGKKQKLFKVNAQTGEETILLDFELIQNKLPTGLAASAYIAQSDDYSYLLYSLKGDLYLYVVAEEKLKRLTATPAQERNPRFSPNGQYLAYTRNHDLFVLNVNTGLEIQLTSDGSDTIYNGWASWVYYEEILGRRSRYAAFWWSPNSRKIAFLRFDDSPVPVFPIFRARGTHGALEKERYPKAGDPNPKVRLGIADIESQKITWAPMDENEDHYIAWPFWYPDSSKITFQWMNRDQTNIKIYSLDLATGKLSELYDEKQTTWVEFFADLYFFRDGRGFLIRSDVDGWAHLYVYSLEGNLKQRLTEGEWTVTGISRVDEKRGFVYFTARKERTTETHLYRVSLEGGEPEKLTKQPGSHRVIVSPEASFFVDTYSNIYSPPRQDLYTADGTFLRIIDQSRTPLMDEYELGKVELFTVPTEDGWELPAYWILPPDFDGHRKYPVLFTIYGGPGASTVSNSFPRLSSFYMAQEGIIVMSVDHRGSGHFGKKGMSLMHRNLGKWEMNDLIEAVKWLSKKAFVDTQRIGITGGSYGGYTTSMALTYGADYFTHGYALYPVTDWRLYDTVYTERYMDRPSENKKGYEFGSVLTHAKKYKGVLFIAHGEMDDNVHMQNTIQLVDKLTDLGKKFELMIYPNQRHGFGGKKREHSSRDYVNFWFKHFLGKK